MALQDHIEPEPNSGCWLWVGATDRGYGKVKVNNRTVSAHRVTYEIENGPVPVGLELDHLCRVRCCVNPRHLEQVTHKENMRRGESYHRNKTHCPQGHEYNKENTYFYNYNNKPNRICKPCKMDNQRRYRAKLKGK